MRLSITDSEPGGKFNSHVEVSEEIIQIPIDDDSGFSEMRHDEAIPDYKFRAGRVSSRYINSQISI